MPASSPGFVDEVTISVSSGRGGDGVVAFRRERYIPKGGPSGGDGGRGGDVILRAVDNINTLAGLVSGRHYRADPGGAGGTALKHGRDGAPIVLEVPAGTLVRDAQRGHVLRDMDRAGIEFAVVRGGSGGHGNKHFASPTNQVPRQSTPGRPGETRTLRLELRLVADAGLVGLPNAGKSTFLRRVSRARPKVADYPFTTLEPVLGLVPFDDGDGLVLADLPGLIEGAHAGTGLGDRFLRHIARTRVLLHLVDGGQGPEAAVAGWRTVSEELRLAGLGLEAKPMLLVVSKADQVPDPGAVVAALAAVAGTEPLLLSSATGQGVPEVLGALRAMVREGAAPDRPEGADRARGGPQVGKEPGPEASNP